jgi:protein-S-isoprenylcysteine O-methyltransferase Ste14
VLAVGRLLLGDAPAFDLPAAVRVAMGALALGGVAIAVVGFRGYHGARFLGLHQLRHGPDDLDSDRDEPLVTAGLHRYVRHPLYTGGMALLWGLAQSPLGLATAVWGSLYFIVGSRFEERALLRRHGESYRAYRRRVPGFIPWKGRAL